MGDQYEPIRNVNGATLSPASSALVFGEQNQYEVPLFPPTSAATVSQPLPSANQQSALPKNLLQSNLRTSNNAGALNKSKRSKKEIETGKNLQSSPVTTLKDGLANGDDQKTVDEEQLKTERGEVLPKEAGGRKRGECCKRYTCSQCFCIWSCSFLLIIIGILLSIAFAILIIWLSM